MHILIFIIVVFVSAIHVSTSHAEIKIFTKDYKYIASDLDSKVSSRVSAMEILKRQLLEEAGVYLQSNTEVVNSELTKDTITTFTAGLVSLELLEEKWDGASYWLKANITVDMDEVTKQIKKYKENMDLSTKINQLQLLNESLLNENNLLKLKAKEANVNTIAAIQSKYNDNISTLRANELVGQANKISYTNKKKANELYDKAILIDPYNIEANRMKSAHYRIDKKYDLATNVLNNIINKYPNNKMLLLEKAILLRDTGKALEAIQVLDFAKSITDNGIYYGTHLNKVDSVIYILSGDIYQYNINNLKLAIDEYTNAINIDNDSYLALYSRATAYLANDDLLLAVSDAKKVMSKTKQLDMVYESSKTIIGDAYINLANKYVKTNMVEAYNWYRQAVSLGRVDAIGQSSKLYDNMENGVYTTKYDSIMLLEIASLLGDAYAMAKLALISYGMKKYEQSAYYIELVKLQPSYKHDDRISKSIHGISDLLSTKIPKDVINSSRVAANKWKKQKLTNHTIKCISDSYYTDMHDNINRSELFANCMNND